MGKEHLPDDIRRIFVSLSPEYVLEAYFVYFSAYALCKSIPALQEQFQQKLDFLGQACAIDVHDSDEVKGSVYEIIKTIENLHRRVSQIRSQSNEHGAG